MASHGVDFAAAGALAAPYNTVCRVFGLTAVNTTATAGAVVIRDGTSTGRVLAAGPVAAAAAGVPGTLNVDFHSPHIATQGLYVEIDGGAITGTVWVG